MNVTVTDPVPPQSSLKDMLLSQPGKAEATEVHSVVEVLVVIAQGLSKLSWREDRAASTQDCIRHLDDLAEAVASQRLRRSDQVCCRVVSGSHVGVCQIEGDVDFRRQQVRHKSVVPTCWVLSGLRWIRPAVGQDQIICTTRAWQVDVHRCCGCEHQFIAVGTTHSHAVGEDCAEVGIQVIGTFHRNAGTQASLVVGEEIPFLQRALVVVVPGDVATVVHRNGPAVGCNPVVERLFVARTAFDRFIHGLSSQCWRRGVLDGDGLHHGGVVATLVRCGERARDHVAVGAAVCRVSNFINGHHATVVGRSRLRERMFFTALSRVVLWDRQLWVRGVLNRDGLRQRRVVAALVCRGEGTCHNVAVGAAVRGVRNLVDGHHAAVVRRRRFLERMRGITLRGVICRNRQLRVRGVLNRDGLRRRRVVAALVNCSERACHHVAVRASERCVRHFHDGVHTAVVRRSRSIERVRFITLGCVIRWDGQHGNGCVLDRDRLSHGRVVVTIIHCRERALDLVRTWAIAWHNLFLHFNGDITVTVVGGRSVVVDDGLVCTQWCSLQEWSKLDWWCPPTARTAQTSCRCRIHLWRCKYACTCPQA